MGAISIEETGKSSPTVFIYTKSVLYFKFPVDRFIDGCSAVNNESADCWQPRGRPIETCDQVTMATLSLVVYISPRVRGRTTHFVWKCDIILKGHSSAFRHNIDDGHQKGRIKLNKGNWIWTGRRHGTTIDDYYNCFFFFG